MISLKITLEQLRVISASLETVAQVDGLGFSEEERDLAICILEEWPDEYEDELSFL